MRGKEVHTPEQQGVVDKGLDKWQNFNKATFVLGAGVGTAGVIFGPPALVAIGFTSAAVDGLQMLVIKEIQRRRERGAVKLTKDTGTIYESAQNRVLLPMAA